MLSHIYVFTAVVVSFVFFDAVNMSQAFSYLEQTHIRWFQLSSATISAAILWFW